MLRFPPPLHTLLAAASLILCLAITFSAATPILAQSTPDAERDRAFKLYEKHQFNEVLPLLEKLALGYPDDPQILLRLGMTMVTESISTLDVERRKQLRTQGRAYLVRARELGVTNDLAQWAISGIAADGKDNGGRFSLSKEADDAMRAGEAAYARNDHDAALKAYERAAKLDPGIYEAPLFTGDLFLRREEWQKAGEWYARAIQLDPNRETAYRYWGDALLRQSRLDEARDKYVEAVIVQPYTGYIWRNGLFRWADKKGVHLGHPKIEPQSSVSPMKDNHMTITIDPKSLEKNGDGTSAWMAYAITRAAWSVKNYERFKKEFPTEKEYRHSLKEEADALRQVVEIVKSQIKDGEIKQLDPALAALVKIHDEGLLEAYILFGRVGAINSIGADYADYGHANRDKLRRYLREYVTSGKY
jgi:tetratricopeptide (TPR) repeat protein